MFTHAGHCRLCREEEGFFTKRIIRSLLRNQFKLCLCVRKILAELAFHASSPRLDEARKYLTRAAGSPTAAAAERGDYLNIWIEESAGGNEAKVIELAKRFLEQHGTSPFAPEVRMKLAELYYQRQDFANAQTQFELIAQQTPDNSLGEKALFFAAESAMSSMGEHSLDRAIVLFDQVVRQNGPLRWAARNEQAV